MTVSRNRLATRGRGVTLVETALVLPIIMLMLMGIIECARYYYIQSVLANAAREGARYAIVNPADLNGITSRARRFSVGLGGANIGVSVTRAAVTAQGAPITVTVSFTTSLLLPVPFGRNLNIISQSTMQAE